MAFPDMYQAVGTNALESEMSDERTTAERKRCLAIIENHMTGHRRSLMGQHLSEADRSRHRQAIATLETVIERIADP